MITSDPLQARGPCVLVVACGRASHPMVGSGYSQPSHGWQTMPWLEGECSKPSHGRRQPRSRLAGACRLPPHPPAPALCRSPAVLVVVAVVVAAAAAAVVVVVVF